MREVEFNEEKFRELILYIAQQSEEDKKFGAVKLNKLLFYSDFSAYREFGTSITGATYQHLQEGPAPEEFLTARKTMIESGAITMERRLYFGKVQQRLVPQRPPNTGLLSADERRIVDEVISEFWHMNARQMSQYSHEEYGWRLTDEGETIPYAAALFSADPLTQEQIERGREVASRHELSA